jgi:NADH-quinone oxidoreductase subunit J
LADTPPKPTRYVEVFFGVILLVISVAFIFWMVARTVLPGLVPVAAEGANLAKPSDLIFYVLAAISIVSAGGVAFSRSIIYSALSLLGALLGSGALYAYLNADYVAISQLLVYVGGVLVLILFAVMLTSRISEQTHTNPSVGRLPGLGTSPPARPG